MRQLAIYIPPISITRLPVLQGLSCFSGFYTFVDVPFELWEVILLCSEYLHCLLACLAKKGVCVFSCIYSGENTYGLLAKYVIVDVVPLFLCFKGDSNVPLEI